VQLGDAVTLVVKNPVKISSVTANGHDFGTGDGFPTTGFKNAKFTLNLSNGGKAGDYKWTSTASWVSVTDGVVTFNREGTSEEVTIKATDKTDPSNVLEYSFTVNRWFSEGEKGGVKESLCDGKGTLAPFSDAIQAGNPVQTTVTSRKVGTILEEWGNVGNYADSGWTNGKYDNHWLKESADEGKKQWWSVEFYSLTTYPINQGYVNGYAMCMKTLQP